MNIKMMIRSSLLAATMMTLALLSGCAKGGSGPCTLNCPEIDVSGLSNGVVVTDNSAAGLNLPITFTATFKNTPPGATWTITGSSCSGSGNPCGSFTSTTETTANYVGPSSVPATPTFTITATSSSDKTLSGTVNLNITPITTQVSPATLNVSIGETQKFTAIALPDNAPQTFTWQCTASGAGCANFVQDPNVSGLASYTPVAGEACGANCVTISAFPTSDPNGTGCSYDPKKYPCVLGKPTVVTSRVTGTYVFRFSGLDNSGNPVFAAGTFVADSNGNITSGFEDEITSSGTTQHSITGGSYTPTSSDPGDSNNAGTLKLTTGAFPNQFQVVLNAAGEIQMIESDSHGSGSGNAELTSTNQFNKGTNQTFAFGFTGVSSTGHRVGYVGLLPTDGNGNVLSGGLIDVNDNGSSTNAVCGAPPCPVAGSYVSSGNGSYRLTLTSPVAMKFDLFVANGQAKSGANLLNLYAISVDPVDASHPAVLGALQFQDPAPAGSGSTYNNAAFNGSSVSVLTGTNGNVALVSGSTNGSSSGSGGTGSFTGTFDQNNLGTIISVPPSASCTSPTICSFTNTYIATNSNTGRYTFQMLGDPNGKVQPISFVLYASGANNGFLLDQSSDSVMTGAMIAPQLPKSAGGSFAPSAMTGTYAVATNSNSIPSSSSCASLPACDSTMNLVLTSPGNLKYNVVGTENPGSQAITGTYSLQSNGVGALTLTSPAANYAIYGVTETNFFMIDLDSKVSSPILSMSQ
jgi:hypothetical protein